jgi:transposase
MARPRKYPPALHDRRARVVIDSGRPIAHVARHLGVPAETLRRYVRRLDTDDGLRPDLPTSAAREVIKAWREEVSELGRANEILEAASVFSRPRPGTSVTGVRRLERERDILKRATALFARETSGVQFI